jgi:arylsulfatase A-like enzyme
MDALADQGVVFETVITQAPWTKGSFASILTSLYPFQHGVLDWAAVMPDSLVTLPELLEQNGYNTMFVANMIGLAGRFNVLKGFSEVSEAGKFERDGRITTDDAIELMRASPEPYFIVVHYYDAHAPYRPPLKYLDLVASQTERDGLVSVRPGELGPAEAAQRKILNYDGCIRFADHCISRLVNFIDETGSWEQTVFMVTADHGEALGEHGVFGHGAEAYDDVLKVPLIITYPEAFPGPKRVDAQVRLLDLHPTILEIAQVPDRQCGEGVSLVPLVYGHGREARPGSFLPLDVALCDCTNRGAPGKLALRTEVWKIVLEPLTSLVELYNLTEDPAEDMNLWEAGRAMGDSLHNLLSAIPGSHPGGWRLAFTAGEGGASYRARVALPENGRFTGVGVLARILKNIEVEMESDSTAFDVRAKVGGIHVVHFETQPRNARLDIEIQVDESTPVDSVFTGPTMLKPVGEVISVRPADAYGLPQAFESRRLADLPGIFIWWLPGSGRTQAGKVTDLSPEERQRLRALGYIQ